MFYHQVVAETIITRNEEVLCINGRVYVRCGLFGPEWLSTKGVDEAMKAKSKQIIRLTLIIRRGVAS